MNITLNQLAGLYPYFGALIVLAALWHFNALKKSSLVTLPVYIIIITLLNLYAEHLLKKGYNATWLFNLVVIPLEFIYFFALFFLLVRKRKMRWLIIIVSSVYAASFLLDLLVFRNEYPHLFRRSYTTGALALFVLAIAYFYELLNSERLLRFYREPGFWISTGLLLFYLGTLPFHITWNYMANSFLKAFYTSKFNFYILMYLMYACFLTSIICLRWKKK